MVCQLMTALFYSEPQHYHSYLFGLCFVTFGFVMSMHAYVMLCLCLCWVTLCYVMCFCYVMFMCLLCYVMFLLCDVMHQTSESGEDGDNQPTRIPCEHFF